MGPKEVVGIFVVDASSGDITRYSVADVPDWVDRVFPANMVMTQINYNGQYQGGYLNSVISKKGVIQNAQGYNYIVLNDDLYLYTGLTSVAADESNIGFVLVNSRTKESKRYNISTATEWSAMESAQGSVQEKGYISTFPLLFNMENKPVYQLSLKDDAGLIKMYAFVNATNYQKVGTRAIPWLLRGTPIQVALFPQQRMRKKRSSRPKPSAVPSLLWNQSSSTAKRLTTSRWKAMQKPSISLKCPSTSSCRSSKPATA